MFLTIRSEYDSAFAISIVRLPSARSRRTATSRGVSRWVTEVRNDAERGAAGYHRPPVTTSSRQRCNSAGTRSPRTRYPSTPAATSAGSRRSSTSGTSATKCAPSAPGRSTVSVSDSTSKSRASTLSSAGTGSSPLLSPTTAKPASATQPTSPRRKMPLCVSTQMLAYTGVGPWCTARGAFERSARDDLLPPPAHGRATSRPGASDEPVPKALGDRVRAVACAETALQICDQRLHGALRVRERVRDLLGVGAPRQHAQHLDAAVVEAGQRFGDVTRPHTEPGCGCAHGRDQLLAGERSTPQDPEHGVRLVARRRRRSLTCA